MARPSDFAKVFPYSSVIAQAHPKCDIMAVRIMQIMADTGDEFREVSFQEYLAKHSPWGLLKKRKHAMARILFERALSYCRSEKAARKFSKYWWRVRGHD